MTSGSNESTELAGLQPSAIVDLAVPVAQRVQLNDVRFRDFSAHRADADRFRGVAPFVQFEHRVIDVGKSDEVSKLDVVVEFSAQAFCDEDRREAPILRVNAAIALTYSISSFDGLSDIQLGSFALMNGVFNAWPYWREYLQSATVRLGLPALIAPVHRIPADRPTDEKSTDPPTADQSD